MGKIFKFHNDVDTDQIIASQYLLYPTVEEMKEHAFESLEPDFAARVRPGDYIVAGENFGCGSSREQAPAVLKALGRARGGGQELRAHFLSQRDQYRPAADRLPGAL